ncbi:DUF2867 domain-containing protein [Kitasatospora sp. NPDC053057]|uniref:DUF2867 domain-containing protein n=1 Tax=Kitasatospora sp. NPDC053057 TaxID=3364062 RepID=UPI0037C721E7
MRLPRSAHTRQPWRIHEFAQDFRIEDVWSYRTPGAGPDDFPVMLAALQAARGPQSQSLPTRVLFAIRWKLGALLGWDDPAAGLGTRVPSLRDRLPQDLRDTVRPTDGPGLPLTPVYRTDTECVAEIANRTVHGLMHLGWVALPGGRHELRMAVLVKCNGRLGRLYMAVIAPFRHYVVYPGMTRQFERAWRDRAVPSTG